MFHYNLVFFFPAVPSSSPRNITVVEITSYSISLMWIPPASEHQNGVIIQYIINVTLVETTTKQLRPHEQRRGYGRPSPEALVEIR